MHSKRSVWSQWAAVDRVTTTIVLCCIYYVYCRDEGNRQKPVAYSHCTQISVYVACIFVCIGFLLFWCGMIACVVYINIWMCVDELDHPVYHTLVLFNISSNETCHCWSAPEFEQAANVTGGKARNSSLNCFFFVSFRNGIRISENSTRMTCEQFSVQWYLCALTCDEFKGVKL